MSLFFGLFNYGSALLFVLFGIYVLIAARNLIRKIIGLTIIQNAVILFYISLAFKWDAGIPILPHEAAHPDVHAAAFANPLPHALMLTAIVVGVSVLGVALALSIAIFRTYKTLEEDKIIKLLESENS